jgi:hypothetical protein
LRWRSLRVLYCEGEELKFGKATGMGTAIYQCHVLEAIS